MTVRTSPIGLAIAFWLSFLSIPSRAAGEAGIITGRVYDPQGAAVPRAQVRILRRSDAFRKETTTDAEGKFALWGLDSGDYQVTAEAVGFPQVSHEVSLTVNGTPTIDLRFAMLAGQNQSVTVTADINDTRRVRARSGYACFGAAGDA
jgi:hypothetical protein